MSVWAAHRALTWPATSVPEARWIEKHGRATSAWAARLAHAFARAVGPVLPATYWVGHRLRTPLALEWAIGSVLLVTTAWGSMWAAQVYGQAIASQRQVVEAAAPRGVTADPAEVRRWQLVLDSLGEANAYAVARRPDWARAALDRVLTLDPENQDALALLHRLDTEPALNPTPEEHAAREREQQVIELVGATFAHQQAGQMDAARWFLGEAEALLPDHPQVRAARASLGAETR